MTFKAESIHLRVECDDCRTVDSYFASSLKKARRYAKQDGWHLAAYMQGAMCGRCTCPRCYKPVSGTIRQAPSDPADIAANLTGEQQ